jgi:hypothetical protein
VELASQELIASLFLHAAHAPRRQPRLRCRNWRWPHGRRKACALGQSWGARRSVSDMAVFLPPRSAMAVLCPSAADWAFAVKALRCGHNPSEERCAVILFA